MTALLDGVDALSIFGPDAAAGQAVFVSGWGLEGEVEAILYAASRSDGSLYWYAVLVANGGFAPSNPEPNQPEKPNQPEDSGVYPTDVQYVMAPQEMVIYSGPGKKYAEIGGVAGGQTATVTGASADGNWWRVMCPDDSVGRGWLSARSVDTTPTDPPG